MVQKIITLSFKIVQFKNITFLQAILHRVFNQMSKLQSHSAQIEFVIILIEFVIILLKGI